MRKILLFLCLLPVCLGSYAQGRLPKITLKDIEGRTIQTDTLSNNGKPFMIAFFATWCNLAIESLKP